MVVVGLGIAAMSTHGAQAANVAPVSMGSVFGGFTSQRLPSFFQLSKTGKMLEVGSTTVNMTCASGVKYLTEDDFQRLPIAASGKLHGTWALAPTKSPDGTIVGGSGSIAAQLDRGRQKLIGTWRVHYTFVSTTGTIDQCESGAVRFTALQ